MIHIFKQGKKDNIYTFLALHGTGGDEKDLIPLANIIEPDVNVLSVRGNVLENGMSRFFKRKAPGVFDMESLENETNHLREFLQWASKEYGFDRDKVIALGYSNGANIAANMLMRFEGVLFGAILLHPMVPNKEAKIPNMNNVKILITAGKMDRMVPYQDAVLLKEKFQEKNANVTLLSTNFGHQIVQEEVLAAQKFLKNSFEKN